MESRFLTEEDLARFFEVAKAGKFDPLPSPKKEWRQVDPRLGLDLVLVAGHLRELRKELDGVVYFVAGGGMVKIGKSYGLTERIRTIQSTSPIPLSLLGHVRGYTRTEAMLHAKWTKRRAHGEWFHLDAEIERWIVEHNGRPVIGVEETLSEPNAREAFARVKAVLDLLSTLYGGP